jgi:hypothetical protein
LVDQADLARTLKPDPDDKNVGPDEMADLARARGMRVWMRVNGDIATLRALVAMGYPVIVETWFIPEPDDEMGHYVLVTGYSGEPDSPDGRFIVADSYRGPRVVLPYTEFDALWRVFNRLYFVLAAGATGDELDAILGQGDTGDEPMWRASLSRAREELDTDPDDAFAAYNLGASALALGDLDVAERAFDSARALGLPWRMLWYQHHPFEAYARLSRWDDVRSLAEANLANAANLAESRYWLGRAHEAKGDRQQALAAYQRALRDQPGLASAREALARLAQD